MTRKKVKLAFIINDSARKATYKKRKKGLLKKVTELTTLCDINACVIIFSPYEAEPEVWPSPTGVHRVLAHFKSMPEMEQTKKMMNQESFLWQRITKAQEQLKKQKKENREMEIERIMFQTLTGEHSLQDLTLADLADLNWVIGEHAKGLDLRIKNINKEVAKSKNEAQMVSSSTDEEDERNNNSMAMARDEEGNNVHNIEAIQMPSLVTEMMNVPPASPQSHLDHGHSAEEDMMLPLADDELGDINVMCPNYPPVGAN